MMSTDQVPANGPTHIAVAVVSHQKKLLVGRRPLGVPLAGFAEFPGGKVEAGESPRDAAVRECLEETGLRIVIDKDLDVVFHQYDYGDVELHFFHGTVIGPTLARAPYEWVPVERLSAYRFAPANDGVLIKIHQMMRD